MEYAIRRARTSDVRVIGGLLSSIRYRRISTSDQRLAWLLVLATT